MPARVDPSSQTDGPPPPEGQAPQAASPAEAGLRLITERLDVPAALLFAADATGALRVMAGVGVWGREALVLRGVAERLDGGLDVLDVSDVVEDARFVAGARLADGAGALLVLSPDDREPDADWSEAFATAVHLAHGLLETEAGGLRRIRLLQEVAVQAGPFEERLAHALERATQILRLDAAAFARLDGGTWTPEVWFDPSSRLVPKGPVRLGETCCAVTAQTDGAFGVEDVAASSLAAQRPAAYLGAPVFVGGRCVGTFSVVGAQPRAQTFTDDDRALVESLAQWVGSALAGHDTARRLVEREAALAAFFDAAPMGMGVTHLVRRPDGADDLHVVAINASAAAHFGSVPDALTGRLASQVGIDAQVLALWVRACHEAASGSARRFEIETGAPEPCILATTVACIDVGEPDGAAVGKQFAFVVEDVTAARRSSDRIRERDAQVEAIVSQAPVALFSTDADGRITMSRGRAADALGLDAAHGVALADLFAAIPEAEASVLRALEGVASSWTVRADDRWFECRTLPTHDDAGHFTGLIGVALDVTERERGAQAIAHASHSLEAAAKARGAFMKHLNHEIRSPLTTILGYTDLLHEDAPSDEVVEVRDVIARSGGRLLAALDDLLDLTLLDTDGVNVTPTPTDVGAVVEAVAEANRTAAEARRIALNLWCTLPEEPILIDQGLFERVARHLVGGAVASATGTRVDVRLLVSGPDQIELHVSGGSGEGAGIGPDLVHRLVAAMGGSSEQTDGDPARWIVRLPRRRVPVVDLGPEEAPAEPRPSMPRRPWSEGPLVAGVRQAG